MLHVYERQRHRQTDRQTDRQRQTQTVRQGSKHTEKRNALSENKADLKKTDVYNYYDMLRTACYMI